MVPYMPLIELGINLLSPLIGQLTKSSVPVEVTDALQAGLDALVKHKADLMSKPDWESQRG